MASHVFYNAFISVNGVDLSDHVKSVTLNYGARMEDDAAMSDDTEINLAGIKIWSLSLNFKQDYDAAKVDATLFPLVGAAKFPIILRPDAGVVAATNPQYTANAVVESYPPMGGAWGDHHQATAELKSAGTLARAVV